MLAQCAPNTAKGGQTALVGAFDRSGIFYAPVNLFGAGENGATRYGVIANGDYLIETLASKFVNGFRPLVRYVDAQLLHDGNRLGPHLCGLGARAENVEAIARIVPQKALGHLAAS